MLKSPLTEFSGLKIKHILLCSLLFGLLWRSGHVLNKMEEFSYITQKNIRYSFTVRNTTSCLQKNIFLEVCTPIERTGTQIRTTIDASHPYRFATDSAGNEVLRFALGHIPPYASEIISIHTRMRVSRQAQAIPIDTARPRYLDPQLYVESDDPQIEAAARSLRRAHMEDTAKSIFQWVSRHITEHKYMGREKGALYAFQNRRGDCTEYADLFAAMCRAVDIPCRRVGGWICRESCVLAPSGYHNWAQFYMNGRWHLADPQKKVFMKNPGDYISMRIAGGPGEDGRGLHRFRVEGEGISAKMN
jgi:hypothetical protein